MKTISLFVNTNVGYDISKFLSNDPSLIIEYLFLSGQYEDIDNKILKVFKNSKTKIIKNSNPKEVSKFLSNSNLDFHITVYLPYLLDKETIQKAKSSVNFHPAFLPINRGWYPHVHSIIDGSKSGVTLHEINEFADNQEQKESHFNAEAEALGKIQLQQRVWNLFGKDLVFSDLITHDIIFDLISKFLGSEFFCGSYCASRLLPGSPGQELHIDYPYWDYYKEETFPMGLNSSFPQNCQATIPLDICSAESGATGYIPGSQKNLHYPKFLLTY